MECNIFQGFCILTENNSLPLQGKFSLKERDKSLEIKPSLKNTKTTNKALTHCISVPHAFIAFNIISLLCLSKHM